MKKASRSNSLSRPKLTRESIFSTALALANQNGIQAVSMRQIADALNVKAMSLYKHVEDKDDVLDGMIELIVSQMTLPDLNLDWKKALHERALSERKVLNKYSWVVTLFESKSGTGVIRLGHQNHMIGILRKSGFPIELAFNAMIAFTGYIYGFVILEHSWSAKPKERAKTVKKAKQMITPADYPHVFEMVSYATSKNKKTAADASAHPVDFEFGLNLILDGFEKLLVQVRTK